MVTRATAIALAGCGLAGIGLAGCGGGGGRNETLNADSGTFYSADQPMGNGVARSFIELDNGLPVRQGMEFVPAALVNLPDVAEDIPAVAFIGPFPSKTHGTAFTNVVNVYSSGHQPPNTAAPEPAHLHVTILIRPPLQTTAPFTLEKQAVVPAEVPAGHVRVVDAVNPEGVIVSGVGVSYDDPKEPANRPPLTTIGQNYFFLQGHMNAIALGPTLPFLKSKATLDQAIKQPQIYPREGYYPRRWKVRFDTNRQVHIIELTDFKKATRVAVPGQ